MRRLSILFFLTFSVLLLSAHPFKPQHYVIVDTDGGIDDYRAICILLASPGVRVLAITSSNGVLDASIAYTKVNELLAELHHEGVLTGKSSDTSIKAANFKHAVNYSWGDPISIPTEIPDAMEIIKEVFENTSEKISFVELGSLKTAENAVRNISSFSNRIKNIVWTSNLQLDVTNFNYALDSSAYFYLKQGNIPLQQIVCDQPVIALNKAFTEKISACTNYYSSHFLKAVNIPGMLYSTRCFDEFSALFLHYPNLFISDTSQSVIQYQLKADYTSASLEIAFSTLLTGTSTNPNQVLLQFPFDTANYTRDVNPRMLNTLSAYGKEEWTACVMACELHRHVGVYAIIGAKMGIRAKEYFGAGIDEMKIVSFAGFNPPYSCMNDGLQVSTGATLGHGLIRIAADSLKLPQADFFYMGRSIRLTLKNSYRSKVETEIKELSRIYGLDSNIYWDLVRLAALNYWANWNRFEIFDIVEITTSN